MPNFDLVINTGKTGFSDRLPNRLELTPMGVNCSCKYTLCEHTVYEDIMMLTPSERRRVLKLLERDGLIISQVK